MNTTASIHVARPNDQNGVDVFLGDVDSAHHPLPGVKEPAASAATSTSSAGANSSGNGATKPTSTPEDKQAARDSTKADPVQAQLKSKAEWLRARLAKTLDSLIARKQDAIHITHHITEHPLPFAIAGAGTLAALVAGVGFLATRRPQVPPTLGERLRAVGEAWQHPERVRRSRVRSRSADNGTNVARNTGLNMLSLVVAEAAKLGLAKYLEKNPFERPPQTAA